MLLGAQHMLMGAQHMLLVAQHMLRVVQHMCDSVRLKLSQLPTKLKLKLKLSLAIMNDSWPHPEVKMCPLILIVIKKTQNQMKNCFCYNDSIIKKE